MEGGGGFESTFGLMGTYGDNNQDTLIQQFSHDQSRNQAHNLSSPMLLRDNNPNKNKTIANPSGYFFDKTDGGLGSSTSSSTSASVKQKIMSHPHYNRVFAAYVSCQKVNKPCWCLF